jgi:nuclear cap-binding protein subunit 1
MCSEATYLHSLTWLPEEPTSESPALTAALKTLSALMKEQKSTLALVVEGFVDLLHPADSESPVYTILMASTWDARSTWSDREWTSWHAWVWFKHFCRVVRLHKKSLLNRGKADSI